MSTNDRVQGPHARVVHVRAPLIASPPRESIVFLLASAFYITVLDRDYLSYFIDRRGQNRWVLYNWPFAS